MEIRQIKALAQILQTSDLTLLEIEENGTKIRLEKAVPVVASFPSPVMPIVEDTTVAVQAQDKKENPLKKVGDEILSPMVGVFYSASSPESDPFVEVGKKVKKGDVICIIEAMKLMNEIQAEVDGEILEILVADGDVVEYGQPLFTIG